MEVESFFKVFKNDLYFSVAKENKLNSFNLTYKGKEEKKLRYLNTRFDSEYLWDWKRNMRLRKLILGINAVTMEDTFYMPRWDGATNWCVQKPHIFWVIEVRYYPNVDGTGQKWLPFGHCFGLVFCPLVGVLYHSNKKFTSQKVQCATKIKLIKTE